MSNTKPDRAHFEAQPWGPAFLREAELVVAASCLESLRSGAILYDAMLEGRIADICAPLDLALAPEFLGVLDADGDAFAAAQATLSARPRGAWAVLRRGDRYDVYASTGTGGCATPSGEKFLYGSPESPMLSFRTAYACVLSRLVYELKNAVRNEIADASLAAAGVAPGSVVRKVDYAGKTWTTATLVRIERGYYVGGTDAYVVRFSRRGAKVERTVEEPTLRSVFAIQPTMPARYDDPANAARLESMFERRCVEAQLQWEPISRQHGLADARYGSLAPFRVNGDSFTRPVYREHDVVGTIVVDFVPASDRVAAARYEPLHAAA